MIEPYHYRRSVYVGSEFVNRSLIVDYGPVIISMFMILLRNLKVHSMFLFILSIIFGSALKTFFYELFAITSLN